jgi:hypothetical protein
MESDRQNDRGADESPGDVEDVEAGEATPGSRPEEVERAQQREDEAAEG